jgi:hypothetical protein
LQPHHFDETVEVHLHAGLVAVGDGIDHTRLIGLFAHDRAGGGVEFRIHRHEMLAVGESGQRDFSAVGDGARQFKDHVDLPSLGSS